jgi:hypothetical protein
MKVGTGCLSRRKSPPTELLGEPSSISLPWFSRICFLPYLAIPPSHNVAIRRLDPRLNAPFTNVMTRIRNCFFLSALWNGSVFPRFRIPEESKRLQKENSIPAEKPLLVLIALGANPTTQQGTFLRIVVTRGRKTVVRGRELGNANRRTASERSPTYLVVKRNFGVSMGSVICLKFAVVKIPHLCATFSIPVYPKSRRLESNHLILCKIRVLWVLIPFSHTCPLSRHP